MAEQEAGARERALDQATLFRAVEEGKEDTVAALLHNRNVDVNAYNDEGVTALFLAVYGYDSHRNVSMAELLLQHGAKVSIKAASPPSAHKVSIVRHDQQRQQETKKVDLDHKTPLLVALELKSALYLKGWEYRHWDDIINVLATALICELEEESDVRLHEASVPAVVQEGWAKLMESGDHQLVEVWAEGHYVCALKELLVHNSKVLKFNIESATLLGSNRVELKEASFRVVKKMVEFMYTGAVEAEFIQSRGIDLFRAAHVYGVDALMHMCESLIVCTPDTWIAVLRAAGDSGSRALALKCAKALHAALDTRRAHRHPAEKPVFADKFDSPNQLFPSPHP